MDCNGWIDPWGLSSAALRRNLGASYGDNKQAQHLIPEEVWNDTFLHWCFSKFVKYCF